MMLSKIADYDLTETTLPPPLKKDSSLAEYVLLNASDQAMTVQMQEKQTLGHYAVVWTAHIAPHQSRNITTAYRGECRWVVDDGHQTQSLKANVGFLKTTYGSLSVRRG